MLETRKCAKCEKDRLLKDFYRDMTWCKPCAVTRQIIQMLEKNPIRLSRAACQEYLDDQNKVS